MNVIATHHQMQCLVMRIIWNDVLEKPILVSVGFGHFRAGKQASQSRSQRGSDKLNKSYWKWIESRNRMTTSLSLACTREDYRDKLELWEGPWGLSLLPRTDIVIRVTSPVLLIPGASSVILSASFTFEGSFSSESRILAMQDQKTPITRYFYTQVSRLNICLLMYQYYANLMLVWK
jgi:hypothetical protein